MNAIREKIVTKGKQFDEHAKRYVFYPLHDLNLSEGQFSTPLWSPTIPKGRIVLLESLEYRSQVNDEETASGGNGIKLGIRTMGTDAQVKHLMGSSDGSGWSEKGMTYIECLTNVDAKTVREIEEAILPKNEDGEISIPFTMQEFAMAVNSVVLEDSPIKELAEQVRRYMLEGIQRSIVFCKSMSNMLDKELADGRAGRIGIKSLSDNQKFYFQVIGAPLPDDKQGANMGNELARVLAPLLGQAGVNLPTPAVNAPSNTEFEAMRQRVEQLEQEKQELEEVIAVTAGE